MTTSDPVILLAHEPDIFPDVPARVALTLAGHTHGGRSSCRSFRRSGRRRPMARASPMATSSERDRHMIVSGGLGTSKVPLRLGVPPEVLRITLGAWTTPKRKRRRSFTLPRVARGGSVCIALAMRTGVGRFPL